MIVCVFLSLQNTEDFCILDLEPLRKEDDHCLRYSVKDLEVTTTSSINLYFNIPEKSVYWYLTIFRDSKCLKTISMSDYLCDETGSVMHFIIANNANLLSKSSKEVEKAHNYICSYKRMLTKIVNIEPGALDIQYSIFFVNKVEDPYLRVFKLSMNNVSYRH